MLEHQMFTLCYYAAIMLLLNVYYAAINLSCYYAAVMLLLLFAGTGYVSKFALFKKVNYDTSQIVHDPRVRYHIYR